MSTSIQQGGASPSNSRFHSPPEWLGREIETRNLTPRSPAGFRHARQVGRRARIIPPAHSRKRRKQYDDPRYRSVRATALASAFAAVAWTSFCIATAIVRLDSANFGQWRDWLVSGEPRITLSERLEAATLALREVSRQVLRPTVFVADSIGVADSALPLSMTVTNYTPETTIVLSKLVTGTTLTSGMSIGEREWRVDIDDLPNVRVVPPLGYVGAMTLVAELRGVDGQSFSLTPVRLTWSAPDGSPSPARNDPPELAAPVTAVAGLGEHLFGEVVALQKDEPVVLPRPKPTKHASVGIRTSKPKKQTAAMRHGHKERAVARDLQASANSRWASNGFVTHSLFADTDRRGERRAFVDSIFRNVLNGEARDAEECWVAASDWGFQKRLRGDCQWRR